MCVLHVVEKMPLSSAPAGACATATDIVKSAIGGSTSPHAQEGPTKQTAEAVVSFVTWLATLAAR